VNVQLVLPLGAPKPPRVFIAPTTRVAQKRLTTSERAGDIRRRRPPHGGRIRFDRTHWRGRMRQRYENGG
jgi:hypothetical protein